MKYYFYNSQNNVELFDIFKDQLDSSNIVFTPDEADCIICCGGDGTLLDIFQKYPNKYIFPIRNHSRCEKHQVIDFTLTNAYYGNIMECYKDSLFHNNLSKFIGISELVIKNQDISKAMRCSLKINDKIYAENIIGDGIICCTPLGSTGYFKNIANTFFTSGIGIGFINNTQGMTNLIINDDSKIEIEILRGRCSYALDHYVDDIEEGETIQIKYSDFYARILNYKNIFMCNECRNKRHSAYVNTIYSVI